MSNQVDFVSAHNGGIQMYSDSGLVGWGNTAESVAYILNTKGISLNSDGKFINGFCI